MIEGNYDYSSITKTVTDEHKTNWDGKKEWEPQVYNVLKKYWSNIGWEEGKWNTLKTGNGTAWSAAYISWIMTAVDSSFPKSAAHQVYAKKGLDNRNNKQKGYQLFSLQREIQPIKVQLGDILVSPRGDGTKEQYYWSHSDVVYKIENQTAFLAGGNVSQTNKINKNFKINPDGSYPKTVKE
jgi:hypothetical protein